MLRLLLLLCLMVQGVLAQEKGLLVVVLTVQRDGVDYLTPLLTQLQSQPKSIVGRLVVHSTDGHFQSDSIEVLQPGSALGSFDPARDKHRDSVERIRWRAKHTLDTARTFEFAWENRVEWPCVLVLEDDAKLSSVDFAPGIDSILNSPFPPTQLAWVLHTSENHTYRHGDVFPFGAGMVGMLYRSDRLRDVAAVLRAHHLEDPVDWLISYYLRDHDMYTRIAVPSIVQHMGVVSSRRENGVGVKKEPFHARDFRP